MTNIVIVFMLPKLFSSSFLQLTILIVSSLEIWLREWPADSLAS